MSGGGNSSPGADTYGFSSGVDPTASQMPSTLGGLNSTSNLTGNGTSASLGGYTPGGTTQFTMPTTASQVNAAQLQNSLAAGTKIAASGQSNTPRQTTMGGKSSISLPTESFSSGDPTSTQAPGSSGVNNLLALMQQLKS